jgi:hypothetical protein
VDSSPRSTSWSAPIESGRVFAAGPPAEEGVQLDMGGDERVSHRVDGDRVAMSRKRVQP